MIVKLLTEHHLEFLGLTGGCTGSSESYLSKCHIVDNHKPRFIIYTIIYVWPGRSKMTWKKLMDVSGSLQKLTPRKEHQEFWCEIC